MINYSDTVMAFGHKKKFKRLDYDLLERLFSDFDTHAILIDDESIDQRHERIKEVKKFYPYQVNSESRNIHEIADNICDQNDEYWVGIVKNSESTVFVRTHEVAVQLAMYA